MIRPTKLQRAERIAQRFDATQQVLWPYWPGGCCFVGVLSLAPLLRISLEWRDLAVVFGAVPVRDECQHHAWIETPEGDIIDPTYGQFDRGPALRVLRAHSSGELGHWAEVKLTPDEEEFYRQSILAVTGDGSGWTEECKIMSLFSDWPEVTSV